MIILRPQPGQKAELAGMGALHCGHEMALLLKNLSLVFSLAAILAKPINLECVAGGFVMILTANLLLETIHLRREEFHRTSAQRANHVMMAATVVLVLEARDSIVKSDLTGQSAFCQQLQGPINCGESDVRVFFLHQAVQFVGREMLPGFQKRSQNRVALRRMLEANPLKVLVQNLLRFPHHLT